MSNLILSKSCFSLPISLCSFFLHLQDRYSGQSPTLILAMDDPRPTLVRKSPSQWSGFLLKYNSALWCQAEAKSSVTLRCRIDCTVHTTKSSFLLNAMLLHFNRIDRSSHGSCKSLQACIKGPDAEETLDAAPDTSPDRPPMHHQLKLEQDASTPLSLQVDH